MDVCRHARAMSCRPRIYGKRELSRQTIRVHLPAWATNMIGVNARHGYGVLHITLSNLRVHVLGVFGHQTGRLSTCIGAIVCINLPLKEQLYPARSCVKMTLAATRKHGTSRSFVHVSQPNFITEALRPIKSQEDRVIQDI